MIRLTLPRHPQAVSFVLSPLWESLGSIHLVLRQDHLQAPQHRAWVHRTRRRLDPRLAAALPEAVAALRLKSMPNCALTSPESESSPTKGRLESELAALRLANAGDAAVSGACEVIERYWKSAVAADWPNLRNTVEDEVARLREIRTTRGAAAALTSLSGQIACRGPRLIAPFPTDVERTIEGPLVVVPMAFSAGLHLLVVAEGVTAMSVQTSRTRAPVASRAMSAPSRDAMSLLLGDGRARVIRSLETPATTTALANAVGLAKSTVSQHLSVLHEAGVVRRDRSGTEVIYRLDHTGYALLRHLQGPRPRDPFP